MKTKQRSIIFYFLTAYLFMSRIIKGCAVLMFKRIVCVMLCGFIFGCAARVRAESVLTVSSECDISDIDVPLDNTPVNAAIGQTLDIKARSAFLIEVNSGKILYEANADEKLPPASITKIMSLLLVMEAIENGTLTTESILSASEHACSMGGSQIWLEPGESMSVDDLLKAAVIASANDATVALGEAVAGSEEGFVALMNEKAASLGMNNTHFVNCTGLDADGHLTTAHDVGIMAAQLIKYDLIKNYSTVWMDTLRDGKSELVNTNKLVRFYEGTTGLKTGTTSTAGYCLAATAKREGLELAAVIMGGETSGERFNGAKKLLDFGFANYTFTEIEPELPKDSLVGIEKGVKKQLKVCAEGEKGVLMLKSQKAELSQELILNENITAPVKKGDTVGQINVYNGEENIAVIELRADEDIKKIDFITMLSWLLEGLFTL